MGRQHVVEHHHVPVLPGETAGAVVQDGTDMVQRLVLDGRTVAVEDMAGKFGLVLHYRKQAVAHRGRQVGDVEQVSLIEPDLLAGHGMAGHRLTDLAGAQLAVLVHSQAIALARQKRSTSAGSSVLKARCQGSSRPFP